MSKNRFSFINFLILLFEYMIDQILQKQSIYFHKLIC